jgi:hypothetical protein
MRFCHFDLDFKKLAICLVVTQQRILLAVPRIVFGPRPANMASKKEEKIKQITFDELS